MRRVGTREDGCAVLLTEIAIEGHTRSKGQFTLLNPGGKDVWILKAHFTSSAAGRALFGILSLQPAHAQTQAINGSIRGRVIDVAGASVPQARVAILNDDTGFTRQ